MHAEKTLPEYSKAKLVAGELYLVKTNPHDPNDIAIHSPQLLSNTMPENCHMVEATGERTYVPSDVTPDALVEAQAQRGHSPSFNSRNNPLANPLRPTRRLEGGTDNEIIDNEFEAPPSATQIHTKTEELKQEESKEAELQKQLAREKQKAADLERAKNSPRLNRNKKRSTPTDKTSLDGVDLGG